MRSFFLHILVAFFSLNAWGNEELRAGSTPEQQAQMAAHNAFLNSLFTMAPSLTAEMHPLTSDIIAKTDVRPYAEYEPARYLIFSSLYHHDSKEAKQTMARHLPDDMILVVYTGDTGPVAINAIREDFKNLDKEDRLRIIEVPDAYRGFWSRDGVPVPVFRENRSARDPFLTVVDAKYYHQFEADEVFRDAFSSQMTEHSYYFEGGNFIANSRGECLVVNTNATDRVPTEIFRDHYGCEILLRLPHTKGIGHADESVKFVDDDTVLTDEPAYVATLEAQGYKVVMLPRPTNKMETYVNSLITNGIVYVPIFDQATDSEALKVYSDLGLEAIGINSSRLSNGGMGSLHCITMTYPETPFQDLLKAFGGRRAL